MSGRAKAASVVATAVEVACPHCDAPVTAPNGSMFWTVSELRAVAGRCRCDTCMLDMRIAVPARAALSVA